MGAGYTVTKVVGVFVHFRAPLHRSDPILGALRMTSFATDTVRHVGQVIVCDGRPHR
jgi:hypothetical protein